MARDKLGFKINKPQPIVSSPVVRARNRRLARASKDDLRIEWFIKKVLSQVNLNTEKKIRIATELIKTRVVKNLSRPVTRIFKGMTRNKRGQFKAGTYKTDPNSRSKRGEFPKADTTQLMKTIFSSTDQPSPGLFRGIVGTPLDYGLILETKMGRSFLKRTMYEQRFIVRRILSAPISK